jgi:hypothetical protein
LPINWLLIRINARVIGDSFAAARGMGRGRCQPGDLIFASMPPLLLQFRARQRTGTGAQLLSLRLAWLSSARQISFRWLLPLMAMSSSACTCTTHHAEILRPAVLRQTIWHWNVPAVLTDTETLSGLLPAPITHGMAETRRNHLRPKTRHSWTTVAAPQNCRIGIHGTPS